MFILYNGIFSFRLEYGVVPSFALMLIAVVFAISSAGIVGAVHDVATDAAPTFTARMTGSNSIEVTFSEQVTGNTGEDSWLVDGVTAAAAEIRGRQIFITSAAQLVNPQEITYRPTSFSSLEDSGAHTVNAASVTISDGVSPTFSATITSPITMDIEFSTPVSGIVDVTHWHLGTPDSPIFPESILPQTNLNLSSRITLLFDEDVILPTSGTYDVRYLIPPYPLADRDGDPIEQNVDSGNLGPRVEISNVEYAIFTAFSHPRFVDANTIEVRTSGDIEDADLTFLNFLSRPSLGLITLTYASNVLTLTTEDSATDLIQYDITHSPITGSNGVTGSEGLFTVTFGDVSAPTLNNARFISGNTVKVDVSEDITTPIVVTVAGTTVPSFYSPFTDTITLKVPSNLLVVSVTRTVAVTLTDASGNSEEISINFPLPPDITPPQSEGATSAQSVELTSRRSIEFTTIEPVMDPSELRFHLEGAGSKLVLVPTMIDDTHIRLDLPSGTTLDILDPTGYVLTVPPLTDTRGNKNPVYERYIAGISADTTPPEILSVEFRGANKIRILLSESAGTVLASVFSISPGLGTISVDTTTPNVIDLETSEFATSGRDYTLTIAPFEDLNGNMHASSSNHDARYTADSRRTFSAHTSTTTTITVTFSEPITGTTVAGDWLVDQARASRVEPSVLNGVSELEIGIARVSSGHKPTIQYVPQGTPIVNLVGNEISTVPISTSDGIPPILEDDPTSPRAPRFTSATTITLQADEIILPPLRFGFTTEPSLGQITSTLDVFTITLTATLPASDGETYTISYPVITDDDRNPAEPGSIEVTAGDLTAPTFEAQTTATDTITLTFNEDVSGTSSPEDWSVDATLVTGLSLTTLPAGTRTLILELGSELPLDATPVVTYVKEDPTIMDAARNLLSGESVQATDGVPLTIPTFTTQNTLTSDSEVTIGGSAEPRSVITLSRNGMPLSSEQTAGLDGTWAFRDVGLVAGDNVFIATATDGSDTSDPSDMITITRDSIIPNAPSFGSLDRIVRTSTIAISGMAEVDATITLFQNDVELSLSVDRSGETWTIRNVPLEEGPNTFTATATDRLHTSPISDPISVTLDSMGPILSDPKFISDTTLVIRVNETIQDPSELTFSVSSLTVTDVEYPLGFNLIVLDVSDATAGNSYTITHPTISDTIGNELGGASLDPFRYVVDRTAPTFEAMTSTVRTITVTFSEGMEGIPSASNWRVAGSAVTGVSPSTLYDETELVLTLNDDIGTAETPNVTYVSPSDPLRDLAGNALNGDTDNDVEDGIAPTLRAAFSGRNQITIVITESVNRSGQPDLRTLIVTPPLIPLASVGHAFDGRTIFLTYGVEGDQSADYEIMFDINAQDSAGNMVVRGTYPVFKDFDTFPPILSNHRFTAPMTIKIDVNEPVNRSTLNFAINNGLDVNSIDYDEDELTITLTTSMPMEGIAYTISHNGFSDTQDTPRGAQELTPITSPDATPPTFTAKTSTTRSIDVMFSEPVMGITDVTHWNVDGAQPMDIVPESLNGARSITFELNYDLGAPDMPTITYLSPSPPLADAFGNALIAEPYDAEDGIRPTMAAIFSARNQVLLTFDEPVTCTTDPPSSQCPQQGVVMLSISPSLGEDRVIFIDDQNIIRYTVGVILVQGVDYVMTLSSEIIDNNGNTVPLGSYPVEFEDFFPPILSEARFINPNTITITVSEPLQESSLSSTTFNIPGLTVNDINYDEAAGIITLTTTAPTEVREYVINHDLIRAATGPNLQSGTLADAISSPDVVPPEFTATTSSSSIIINFTEPVTGITENTDWTVEDNIVDDVSPRELNGGLALVLTLGLRLDTDERPEVAYAAQAGQITDTFGNHLSTDPVTPADGITPSIRVEFTGRNQITIFFSEFVNRISSAVSLPVTPSLGPTTPAHNIFDNTIRLTYGMGGDQNADYVLDFAVIAEDEAGNRVPFGQYPVAKPFDSFPPVLSNHRFTSRTMITIDVSEPIRTDRLQFSVAGLRLDDTVYDRVANTITLSVLGATEGESYIVSHGVISDEGGTPRNAGSLPAITFTIETNPPTFEAENTGPETVRVIFSEPVSGNTFLSDWQVASTSVTNIAPSVLNGADSITLTVNPRLDTDATPLVTYTAPDIPLKDAFENNMENGSEMAIDKSKPALTDVLFASDTSMTIRVSEEIMPPDFDAFSITGGLDIADTEYLSEHNLIRLEVMPEAVDNTSYVLTHPVIEDVAGNTLDAGRIARIIYEMSDVRGLSYSATTQSTTSVRIEFDDAVTGSSIPGDWNVEGNTVSAVTPDGSTSYAALTLDLSQEIDHSATPGITYTPMTTSLMSVIGQAVTGATITASDGIDPVFTARTVAPSTIAVSFVEPITGDTAPEDWTVEGFTVSAISDAGLEGILDLTDDLSLELILSTPIPTDATPVVTYITRPGGLVDVVGNIPSEPSVTADDGIGPVLTVPRFVDSTTITIRVSEDIDDPAANSFSLDGVSVGSVYSEADDLITLTVPPATIDSLHVIAHPTIVDDVGNPLTSNELQNVRFTSDTEQPMFMVETTSTNTITVTFTEAVDGTTSESDWRVDGVAAMSVAPTTLSSSTTLLITTAVPLNDNSTPSVQYVAPITPITDTSSNDLESASSVATDGISPTIRVEFTARNQVTIFFSEPVVEISPSDIRSLITLSPSLGPASVGHNTFDNTIRLTHGREGDLNTTYNLNFAIDAHDPAGNRVDTAPVYPVGDGGFDNFPPILSNPRFIDSTTIAIDVNEPVLTESLSFSISGLTMLARPQYVEEVNEERNIERRILLRFSGAVQGTDYIIMHELIRDFGGAIRGPGALMGIRISDSIPPMFDARTTTTTTILLTFDEPIVGTPVAEDWNVTIGDVVDILPSVIGPDGTETLTLVIDPPLGTGDRPIVNYDAPSSDPLTDIFINPIFFNPETSVDGVPPSITQVEFDSSNQILVSLSERVIVPNIELELLFTLNPSLGTFVLGHDTNNNEIRLTFGERALMDVPYTLNLIADISDDNSDDNTVPQGGYPVGTTRDVFPPVLSSPRFVNPTTIAITVNEPVSSLTTNTFTITGLTITDTPRYDSDIGAILIPVSGAMEGTDYEIEHMNILDMESNSLTSNSQTGASLGMFRIDDATRPEFTAKTSSATSVTLTFDEVIRGVPTASDWEVGGSQATDIMPSVLDDDAMSLTLILGSSIGTDETPSVEYVQSSVNVLTDDFGNTISEVLVESTDGVPPTLDIVFDSFIQILITPSEPIDVSASTQFPTVPSLGPSRTSYNPINNEFRITYFTGSASQDTPYLLDIGMSIKDMADNYVPTMQYPVGKPNDVFPPVLSNPRFINPTVIGITVNEPVQPNTLSFTFIPALTIVGTPTYTEANNLITIIVDAVSPGDYRIRHGDILDIAFNRLLSRELTETITSTDTAGPTFTAKTTSLTTVEVMFNEGIDGTTVVEDWMVTGSIVTSITPDIFAGGQPPTLVLTLDSNLNTDTPLVTYVATENLLQDGFDNSVSDIPVRAVDGIAPDRPIILTPSGHVTSASIDITGTAEAGSTVRLLDGDMDEIDSIVTQSGAWTFASVFLSEGINTFTATASDERNTSVASVPLILTVDSTVPDAPEFRTSDRAVRNNQISIFGTAEPESMIVLSRNGVILEDIEITTGSDGRWEAMGVLLREGPNIFTATASDRINAASEPSDSVTIILDSIAPSLFDAEFLTATSITIQVSEPLKEDFAPVGFSIEPSLGTVDASYSDVENQITLVFPSNAIPGRPYSIVHPIIDDVVGNSLNTDRLRTIMYIADRDPPGFSAKTTSNTLVTVTFTEPVSGTTAANEWQIGVNVPSGISKLRVANPPDMVTLDNDLTLILALDNPLGVGDTPNVGYVSLTTPLMDASGNPLPDTPVSGAMVIGLTDGVAPAAPRINELERYVSDRETLVSGTAEPRSVVTLFLNGEQHGNTIPVGTGGNWRVAQVLLAIGDNVFTATTSDGTNPSPTSTAVTVTRDNMNPSITGAEFTDDMTIVIQVSEVIVAPDMGVFSILPMLGAITPDYSGATMPDANTVPTITLNVEMAADVNVPYTITHPTIADRAGNTLSGDELDPFEYRVPDTTPPEYTARTTTATTITLSFDEGVDGTTDPRDWTVTDNVVTRVSLVGDTPARTLDLPNDTMSMVLTLENELDTDAKPMITYTAMHGQIEDAADNALFTTPVESTDGLAPEFKARTTGVRAITVTFPDEDVRGVTSATEWSIMGTNPVSILSGGVTVTPTSELVSPESLVLMLGEDLGTGDTPPVQYTGTALMDEAGNSLFTSIVDVDDSLAPKFRASVVNPTTVVVTFTEPVSGQTVNTQWSVMSTPVDMNTPVNMISLTGDLLQSALTLSEVTSIELMLGNPLPTNAIHNVMYADINDALLDAALLPLDDDSVSASVMPILYRPSFMGNMMIMILVSEEITPPNDNNFEIMDGDGNTVGIEMNVGYSATDGMITLTLENTPTTGDTYTISHTNIQDVDGATLDDAEIGMITYTASDTTAPSITSATFTNARTIVMVFSEAIEEPALDGFSTDPPLGTITAMHMGNTITLPLPNDATSGEYDILYPAIFDAANNELPTGRFLDVPYMVTIPPDPLAPTIITPARTVGTVTTYVIGTAEASTTVTLLRNDMALPDTMDADSSGNWSFENVPLDVGPNTFTATTPDGSNPPRSSDPVIITHVAPTLTAPTITTPPNIETSTTITIEGTAVSDHIITLSNNGIVLLNDMADGLLEKSATGGTWEFTNVNLDQGANIFTAEARSGESASLASDPVTITNQQITFTASTKNSTAITITFSEPLTGKTNGNHWIVHILGTSVRFLIGFSGGEPSVTDDIITDSDTITLRTNRPDSASDMFSTDDTLRIQYVPHASEPLGANGVVLGARTVDTTDKAPPTLTAVTLTLTKLITVMFSEGVVGSTAIGDWTVTGSVVTGVSLVTASFEDVLDLPSGTRSIVLQLASELSAGATPVITYTKPTNMQIADALGNLAAHDSAVASTSFITIARTAFTSPTYTAHTLTTNTIELRFDEGIHGTTSRADWAIDGVSGDTSLTLVSSLSLAGDTTLTLTLTTPIPPNSTPTVKYTPQGASLADVTANPLSTTQVESTDGIRPAVPSITDGNRSVNTETTTISGSAEAGSTVVLTKDGSEVNRDTITGTAWSFSSVPLDVGSNTFTVTVTDVADNTPASATVTITRDMTAPTLSNHRFTSATTIEITVSEVIEALVNEDFTISGNLGVTVNYDGANLITLTLAPAATTGTNYIIMHRTITDLAGNELATNSLDEIQLPDTTAPAMPTITDGDRSVNTETTTISGTAEAGSTVILFREDGSEAGRDTADGGNWLILVTLVGGENIFTATATDAADNISASATVTITREVMMVSFDAFTSSSSSITVEFNAELSGTTMADHWTVTDMDTMDTFEIGFESNAVGGSKDLNNERMLTLRTFMDDGTNTAKEFSTDATLSVVYTAPTSNQLVNTNNLVLDSGDDETTDRAPPTLTAKTTSTTSVAVTFSEDVRGNTATENWTVTGSSVTGVSLDGTSPRSTLSLPLRTTSIVLELGSEISTDATPTVTYTKPTDQQIADMAGNLVSTDTETPDTDVITITASDAAPPVLTAAFIDLSTILVTVSEDIRTSPPLDMFSTIPDLGTVTQMSYNSGRGEITLTTTDAADLALPYMLSHPEIMDMNEGVLRANTIPILDMSPPAITGLESRTIGGQTFFTILFNKDIMLADPNTSATVEFVQGTYTSPTLTQSVVMGRSIIVVDIPLMTSSDVTVTVEGIANLEGNTAGISRTLTPTIIVVDDSTIPVTVVPAPSTAVDLTLMANEDTGEDSVTFVLSNPINVDFDPIYEAKLVIEVNDVKVTIPSTVTARLGDTTRPSTTPEEPPTVITLAQIIVDPIERSGTYVAAPSDPQNARIAQLLNSQQSIVLLVEVGNSRVQINFQSSLNDEDNRVIVRLVDASPVDFVYYVDGNTVHNIEECRGNPTILETPFSVPNECYSVDGRDIVIRTNHFTAFGAVNSSGGTSGGDGCDDCTPPTLGVDNTGTRRVTGGFSYNGDTVDVEHYYTPLPLISVNVGEENIAVLKIFEDTGPERIRHVGLAFGLTTGQHFAESQAEIRLDMPFSGGVFATLDDPNNVIDGDLLGAETTTGQCMAESTTECLHVTIYHTFREPLEFDIVSTVVWDERLNSWQNFYNHGIEVTGESLNPRHGIEVNNGALILYPLITSNVDENGDGVYDYDARHVTYMTDTENTVYRLTHDGTYEPIRNLYSQLHNIDESMYDPDDTSKNAVRESERFEQMMREQAEIARQILGEMEPESDPELVTEPIGEQHADVERQDRMDALKDTAAKEANTAMDLSKELYPSLHSPYR